MPKPILIRGLINLPPNFSTCVATIGNFDGVHLGHQALIKRTLEQSAALHLPSVLITFEPQPNEFFTQNHAPARLTRLREKYLAIQSFPLDYLLCLRFNETLAKLSPNEFVRKTLVEQLKISHIIVGDDFHFGNQRSGDIAVLKNAGEQCGFTAEAIETYQIDHQRVSSSRVRLALEKGDMDEARKLLGRGYCIAGRVAEGHQRGRIIGFPTANIFLHRNTVAVNGVYAVRIHGVTNDTLYGVANVGTRPTVDGTRTLLEAHIFNFNQDIYGRAIGVEFVKKLRDEKRYDSFELLKQQILKDAEEAASFFATAT